MGSPALEADLAARAVAAHGIVCQWTPEGGQPIELLGVFDNTYFDDTGAGGIQTDQAACQIASAQAPDIAPGEAFVANGQNYTITIVKDDGAGMSVLALKRTP